MTSTEQPVADPSVGPSISGNGTRTAFQSFSDDLVPNDANGLSDVFVRDVSAGTTRRVSVARNGGDPDGASTAPSISASGRFVSFTSDASNLVAGDDNGVSDVFRRDLQTGVTTRVSVQLGAVPASRQVRSSSISDDGAKVCFVVVSGSRSDVFVRNFGAGSTSRVSVSRTAGAADGSSFSPTISGAGRYVAFLSQATNLVAGDTNGFTDVFRRDLSLQRTLLVSRDRNGGPADAGALQGAPDLSSDGKLVVFHSEATDLVPSDLNNEPDVFRRNMASGVTTLVSVTSNEQQVTGFGSFHTVRMGISGSGRFVAFSSDASGLTPDDHNGQPDSFVRDTSAGTTRLASRGVSGTSPSGFSIEPSITQDGRFVAFSSDAPGLNSADTNGEVNDVFRARVVR
ncbi:MAG: TolB-like protein [Marmoricola sp.]|nr:TolB-like protein [Marmoricola sp.]